MIFRSAVPMSGARLRGDLGVSLDPLRCPRDGSISEQAPTEDPPEPRAVSTLTELTAQLHTLRWWAGQPSLRRLREFGGTRRAPGGGTQVASLPESSTSHVLRGDRPANAEFVRAFVTACLRARGRDQPEITRHVERWHQAWLAASGYPVPSPEDPPTAPPAIPSPVPCPLRGRTRLTFPAPPTAASAPPIDPTVAHGRLIPGVCRAVTWGSGLVGTH